MGRPAPIHPAAAPNPRCYPGQPTRDTRHAPQPTCLNPQPRPKPTSRCWKRGSEIHGCIVSGAEPNPSPSSNPDLNGKGLHGTARDIRWPAATPPPSPSQSAPGPVPEATHRRVRRTGGLREPCEAIGVRVRVRVRERLGSRVRQLGLGLGLGLGSRVRRLGADSLPCQSR